MSTPGTRLALFDADGVLLDSLTPHLRICEDKNRALNLGLTIPTAAEMKEMVRRNVRISPMKYFFTAVGFSDALAEQADADYQATFARDYPSPCYAGIDVALTALRDAGFVLVAAMSLCAATRESTVYIGDQPGDLAAARAAGVPFVAAAYGWGFAAHGNPFPTVTDVSELPDCLGRLIPR